MTPPAIILRRLDSLGAANVARAVAPAWGYDNPDQALERLSRYRAHLEGRGGRDMTSEPLFALLAALGLVVVVRLLETGRTATTERDLGGLARANGERGRAVVGLVPPADLRAAIVALYTGMREGELWTLHRTDVDLAAGRLVVRYGGRGRAGLLPTKGRRPRTLQLLPPAVEALREQLSAHPHALAFPSPSPTHPGAYRAPRAPRSFAPWLAAAGLTAADRPDEAPVTWHSLRHTFATLALAGRLPGCEGEGWRLERVSAYLGHTSIGVTQRYADVAALL